MGSVTEMKDVSGEKRRAVVFKHFPDKGSVTVVDVKSRKKKTVSVPLSVSLERSSETVDFLLWR